MVVHVTRLLVNESLLKFPSLTNVLSLYSEYLKLASFSPSPNSLTSKYKLNDNLYVVSLSDLIVIPFTMPSSLEDTGFKLTPSILLPAS